VIRKGDGADPRILHISSAYLPFGVPVKSFAEGFEAGLIIAEGGTGIVVSATRKNDEAEFVVKFLRPEVSQYRRGVERFLAYLRTVKSRAPHGVAGVVSCGYVGDGIPYVVTRKAPGIPLGALSKKSSLEFDTIAKVLLNLCGTLIEMHAAGLTHGAMKPSRVFVDLEGDGPSVTLLPSGNHLLFHHPVTDIDRSHTGFGAGSVRYVAPEQIRGELAGHLTDVYAFGLLAYEMTTGDHVFTSGSPAEILLGHLRKEPQPPSKKSPRAAIPSRFDDLVLRCLEKDPGRRPASIAAVRRELENLCAEEKAAKEMAAGFRSATVEELDAMAIEFLENPDVPELAEEIINLARGAKAWERGIDILTQAIEKLQDKEARKGLLYKLAAVYEKDVKDFDEAAKAYGRILELYPDDEVAEAGVMDSLRNLGRYDDLVGMILDKLSKAEDDKTRDSLLREIAALYEREVNEPSKALLVFLQLFESNPGDREISEAVARLADATNGWEEAFGTVNKILNQPNVAAERAVAVCNIGASWYASKLGRSDFALALYQKALSLSPSDETALIGVARILQSKGEHKELINILQRLADAKPPGVERRELRMEIASTYEQNLGDAKQAESIYSEILEEDPLAEEAFTSLEKTLTHQERWKDLAKFARTRADLVENVDRKVSAYYALAEMLETRLDEVQEAISLHKKIIALKPDYILSLKALELLLTRVGDVKELASILEKEVGVVSSPKQRFDLFMRQAAILEEEFIQHDKALIQVNQALEIDPANLTALDAKARLVRKLERYDTLVEVLEKQVELQEDHAAKVALLQELARILFEKFKRFQDATARLELAVELSGKKKPELVADLVEVCEASGDYPRCISWLEHLADGRAFGAEKADIWVRIGDIQKEKLGDAQASMKSYQRASDFDPANVKAASALKAVFVGRGDHGATLQMLRREIEATEGAIAKARLFTEMGRIYRQDLKDVGKAIEHYEKAFKSDSTSMEAGEALAELYRENGRWDDANKIFEHFSESAGAMKKEKALELFLRYGEASLKMNDLDKAKRAFSKAREIDPKDGYCLERYAHTMFEMKDWKAANAAYADYLLRFSDTLEKSDKVAMTMCVATCCKELDELPRALEMLGKAVEIDPDHLPAYRMKVAIHEKRQEWEETVQNIRNVMEYVNDAERFDLLIRAGDILKDRLGDDEKASKSYGSALEIRPDHRATLLKLVQLYMKLEKWQKVVEVVLQLADLVEDKKELATYYKTAAQLCDQYLGRKDDALSYYEAAIENDATQLDLLDSIGNILTDKKEWLTLERTYRKMLDKLPEGVAKEIKANLWQKLAELYLHRLERKADAVNAYETALKLDPSKRGWMESLAELYGDDMRYSDKAIALNREILQLNPYSIESYKTLCRIYRKKGKYDQSWCVASTLNALAVEDEDVMELYSAYKSDEPAAAMDKMSEDLWSRYLIHPMVDEKIVGIFRILEAAILQAKAQSYKSANLKPEHRIDAKEAHETLPRTFHYAAGVLDIPLPDFYLWREDKSIGIIFTPTAPPAIVVGGEALKEENTQTLAFVAARHLTYYLPGFYLRVFLQTGTALSTWLLAAIKFVIPQFPVPGEFKNRVPDAVGIMKKFLDQNQKEILTAKVQTFMESVAGGIDLKKWSAGVDFTADRAGLLVCNDARNAFSVIRKMHVDSWFAPVKDRVAELSLFSVSDEFFILREKLGFAIQTE
jgi:tetratricopeptide (TPR) repeat protein